MRRISVALVVVLSVGCGAATPAPASAPARVQVPAVEAAAPEPAEPSEAPSTEKVTVELGATASPELVEWLRALGQALIDGDPETILGFFDGSHREHQRQMGIGDFQYINESIGLIGLDQLESSGPKLPHDRRLRSIDRISMDQVRPTADGFTVSGRIQLTHGDAFRLELRVVAHSSGTSRRFVVRPAAVG